MGARLTFEMARIGEKLGRHVASVMDYNRLSPSTLTHFDYQLDNIFFNEGNTRHIIVTFLMDLSPDMEHRFLDIVIPRYFDAIFDMNAEELLPL